MSEWRHCPASLLLRTKPVFLSPDVLGLHSPFLALVRVQASGGKGVASGALGAPVPKVTPTGTTPATSFIVRRGSTRKWLLWAFSDARLPWCGL